MPIDLRSAPLTGDPSPITDRPHDRPATRRIVVDSLLLATFAASLVTLATGLVWLHVLAGTAFLAVAVAHVWANRRWVRRNWRPLTPGRPRWKSIDVDATLAASWLAVLVTGLALWPFHIPQLGDVHGPVSAVLLVAVLVHLLLHLRWIRSAARSLRVVRSKRRTRAS